MFYVAFSVAIIKKNKWKILKQIMWHNNVNEVAKITLFECDSKWQT